MYIDVSKTVSVLSLLVSLCHGENSAAKPSEDVRQERTFKPSHSSGNLLSRSSSHSAFSNADSYTAGLEAAIGESCSDDDAACLTQASEDRVGLEAIRSLHRQLDDDANGSVDVSESDEFLREELNYAEGHERRQQAFHRNNDKHISVKELWEAWIRSEVHNWTVEQTAEWLATNVELPQYIPTFIVNRVTGATLPRLAANNMHYLSNILGIKDPIHKQKIALKAMDVVLFGPPKDYSHGTKDIILITLLLGALIGCYYAYHQNKNSKKHLKRMMKDMESLHKAELALDKLQKELEQARFERACVTTEKQNLEKQLLQCDNVEMRTSYSDLKVSQLKSEIEVLRRELQRAEGELEDRCWSPPVGLQQWLQLTHEIENKAYIKKKLSAEKQLQQAREACEKLRKKRSSLVGAFVSTHGKSIDDVDRSIVEARTALNEVTQELKERVHRWKQIELLCGFNIINNSGLQYLENVLYRGTANGKGGSSGGLRGRMGSSHDDLDDDSSSLYSPSAGCTDSMQWKEGGDSSGSEAGKQEQDDDFQADSRSLAGGVHFTIGSDSWPEDHTVRTKSRSSMIRSYSQDTNVLVGDREGPIPTISQSETCLDASGAYRKVVTSSKRQSREHLASNRDYNPQDNYKDVSSQESVNKDQVTSRESTTREASKEPTPSVDDETYSTDSNSTTEDDIRRRKRKLFYFSPRKPKSRMT